MIYAKVPPVVRKCSMIISILLIFLTLSNQAMFAQCPEGVHHDGIGSENSEMEVLIVLDANNSSIDISDFEINIYSEITANYLITESQIFPNIGLNENIEISKSGNKIIVSGLDEGINLKNCLIVFVGKDCPLKKIQIKDNL